MAPIALDQKQCTKCLQLKPRSEFSRIKTLPNAIRSQCKMCCNAYATRRNIEHKQAMRTALRRYRLKKNFGITIEQYDDMLAKQNYRCALCGIDTPGGKGRFKVDHCHETKAVRGLLCQLCNIGLGHFRDDTDLLARAIIYLEGKGVRQ